MTTTTIEHRNPSTFVQATPPPSTETVHKWDFDKQTTTLLEGGEKDTISREVAIQYLQERFGVVYQSLCAEQQSDPEILMLAAVQSSGHTMKKAPEGVTQSLSRDWWLEAFSRGVRGWAIRMASDEIKDDAEVGHACVSDDGDAIQYLSERLRKDHEIQAKAVLNNISAIKHCIDPSDDLRKVADEKRSQTSRIIT